MKNIKSLDLYVTERNYSHLGDVDVLEEGLRDFFALVWDKLVTLVRGKQKVFLKKLTRETNKNRKVRMLDVRIEELARDYVDAIVEKDISMHDPKLVRVELNLLQLLKIYKLLTGVPHDRDVPRKTGLFDRAFLWPDLIRKGVTKEDIEQQYSDKIESIRTRADRKIKKAEEELAHFMTVLT